TVLYTEIYPLILALRTAGFAAWFRDFDELYDGSPVHIHAVAIGDKQLSEPAAQQLDGEYGYFYGYSGLPASNWYPSEDRYGGPIYCNWMSEMGYPDVVAVSEHLNEQGFREKISEVYTSYITQSWEETILLAHNQLNLFYDYSPMNYSGHLMETVLKNLNLIPKDLSPDYKGMTIWQPTNKNNPDHLSLFTHPDFELFEFSIPVMQFDFEIWRLFPGDIVYVYPSSSISSRNVRLFLITEVDEPGVVYGLGVKDLIEGQFIIERLLLYDPLDINSGMFFENLLEFGNDSTFDILRLRRFIPDPDEPFEYFVKPGDTLATIADEFFISVEAIVQINEIEDTKWLEVNQKIIIPNGFEQIF
ncbi:MAG: LysM peptidoglycan-binding domain-containing protein, partial [Anaerolineaceae bacterium]|nr:LysM peptidoglycan-binding domain-containing protein [Anaerolineaceae bacterium]